MLQYYELQTKHKEVVYDGYFKDVSSCVEQALSDDICLHDLKLNGLNLTQANLDGADFTGCDFSGANLAGANLSEARLNNCLFSNARMTDACLCESEIKNTIFHNTLFSTTDLSHAHIERCLFSCFSTFSLNFDEALHFRDCVFNLQDTNYMMRQPPVVIKGLPRRLVVIGKYIIIGTTIRSFVDWQNSSRLYVERSLTDEGSKDDGTIDHLNHAFFRVYRSVIQSICEVAVQGNKFTKCLLSASHDLNNNSEQTVLMN